MGVETKELTLNEYQEKAMTTCLPTSNNHLYMLGGLTEEVGELNGKIAKAIRKGWIKFNNNDLIVLSTCPCEFSESILKELGDVMWMTAGLAKVFGLDLNSVCQSNLDKLADRKKEGTIISHTDH